MLDQAQKDASEATRLALQITHRDTELFAAKARIQALVLELAHLRRMRFGTRSEALSAAQRVLFQETLDSDSVAAEAELARQLAAAPATPVTPPAIRSGAGRLPLPEHLPRIEHRHEPESCLM